MCAGQRQGASEPDPVHQIAMSHGGSRAGSNKTAVVARTEHRSESNISHSRNKAWMHLLYVVWIVSALEQFCHVHIDGRRTCGERAERVIPARKSCQSHKPSVPTAYCQLASATEPALHACVSTRADYVSELIRAQGPCRGCYQRLKRRSHTAENRMPVHE